MAVSLLLLWGCDRRPAYQQFEGATMGTRYHITVKLPKNVQAVTVKAQLEQKLEAINVSMSTWRDDSMISAFNQAPLGASVSVDQDFINVLDISRTVFHASNGAFNPGVGVLIDLWGFGRYLTVDQIQQAPTDEAISHAMSKARFADVQNAGLTLIKSTDIKLNFSAVAKGYAVDVLAKALRDVGAEDYMVEIGGEIATLGKSPRGTHWRIGIEAPEQLKGRSLSFIQVEKAAMATSGDYRNYIDIDGKRYSHTIDPRTGKPMENNLASVTVLADTVGLADAWATAMMVVGAEEALEMAEKLGLAVYLISRRVDGEFVSAYSSAMKPYLN